MKAGQVMHQNKRIADLKFTRPETNSSPLKMDGWKTSFLLGWPIFRCYVSFREGIPVFFHRISCLSVSGKGTEIRHFV